MISQYFLSAELEEQKMLPFLRSYFVPNDFFDNLLSLKFNS